MIRFVAAFLLIAMPALAQPASGPSFDCRLARSWDERNICAFADLAALDREIAATWRQLTARLPPDARARLQAEQRAWLTERKACEGPVAREAMSCLRRLMRARARDLAALAEAGGAGQGGSASSGTATTATKPPPAEAPAPTALRAVDCARPTGWLAERICTVPGMSDLDRSVVRDVEATRRSLAANPAALADIEAAVVTYMRAREACAQARGRVPTDCLQETMEDMRSALQRRIGRG